MKPTPIAPILNPKYQTTFFRSKAATAPSEIPICNFELITPTPLLVTAVDGQVFERLVYSVEFVQW